MGNFKNKIHTIYKIYLIFYGNIPVFYKSVVTFEKRVIYNVAQV